MRCPWNSCFLPTLVDVLGLGRYWTQTNRRKAFFIQPSEPSVVRRRNKACLLMVRSVVRYEVWFWLFRRPHVITCSSNNISTVVCTLLGFWFACQRGLQGRLRRGVLFFVIERLESLLLPGVFCFRFFQARYDILLIARYSSTRVSSSLQNISATRHGCCTSESETINWPTQVMQSVVRRPLLYRLGTSLLLLCFINIDLSTTVSIVYQVYDKYNGRLFSIIPYKSYSRVGSSSSLAYCLYWCEIWSNLRPPA